MKEHLTGSTLFNTIALLMKESTNLLLVVEGDSDRQALKNHCSSDLQVMAGVGGRAAVLQAAALTRRHRIGGVRFLVDRDFDAYLDVSTINIDLVWASTHHDIFLDFHSVDQRLLARIVDQHTASARRAADETRHALPSSESIVESSVDLATHMAAIRLVNAREDLGLDFKRLSFFQLRSDELVVETMTALLISRSEVEIENAAAITASTSVAYDKLSSDPMPPIGDHDLFSAIARFLKPINISVSETTLQVSFLLSISCSHLAAVAWYDPIQAWCAENGRLGFKCHTGDCVTRWGGAEVLTA